jgi:hypothetical protein
MQWERVEIISAKIVKYPTFLFFSFYMGYEFQCISVNNIQYLLLSIEQVCLQWDEEEVCAALKDKQLLASILNDASCLS